MYFYYIASELKNNLKEYLTQSKRKGNNMIKKISTAFLILVVIGLALNFTFKNSGDRKTQLYPQTVITGFEQSTSTGGQVVNADANNFDPIVYSDSVVSYTDVRTGPETIYDLQSNGVPQQIWQDPNTPQNIHAVYTVNLTPTWPAADRRVYYMFSSDYGATWTDYGPNPTTGTNGFGFVSGLSDGSAIIGGHTDFGSAPTRLQVFADVAPGAGTFTTLDPGSNPFNSLQNIWGRIQPTSSLTNPTKFVIMGSINTTSADTVASYNRGLSVTTSSFSGYVRDMNIGNAEVYSFARGSDGRIGLVYVANDNVNLSNTGKAYYTYSTDDGATWTAPLLIWNPPVYLDGLYGVMRGISITYVGTTPKVAFELVGVTTTGTYYPSGKAGIGFWSPDVNGGNAVETPFDSTWSNNGNGGATDVMASISRPSISRSNDGQVLMMAFLVSRSDTDAIGSHYYDVYLTTSSNGGSNWKFPPTRLTNNSGPLRDNRFVSLSPTNDKTGGYYYANLVYQQDSVAGSVTQTPPAAESLAKQRFIRAKLDNVIGINQVSNEVPFKFNLEQNYPNPFNPVTKIRFSVPKSANITLEVFDVTGKLIATLARNEAVTPGVKEVEFNAVNLPSGVYFYSIKSGSYSETKKMVLIK